MLQTKSGPEKKRDVRSVGSSNTMWTYTRLHSVFYSVEEEDFQCTEQKNVHTKPAT